MQPTVSSINYFLLSVETDCLMGPLPLQQNFLDRHDPETFVPGLVLSPPTPHPADATAHLRQLRLHGPLHRLGQHPAQRISHGLDDHLLLVRQRPADVWAGPQHCSRYGWGSGGGGTPTDRWFGSTCKSRRSPYAITTKENESNAMNPGRLAEGCG